MKDKKVRCPKCDGCIHIDDLGAIDRKGFWHKKCYIREFKDKIKKE